MDGKRVAINEPPNSGAHCFNYKGFYSIVLFGIANAKYEFIYVKNINQLQDLQVNRTYNNSTGREVRDAFKNYFNSSGAVSYQNNI